MKNCKNCGTQNETTAVKCINCKMEGHFTLHVVEEPKVETIKEDIQCINCGDKHPGEGSNCVHCNFPLKDTTTKKLNSVSVQVNKKVG